MKAKICIEHETLEELEVKNGLRQVCCMAPVLFNLYTSVLLQCWKSRVGESDGVGLDLRYKMDKKLFRRSTRNAEQEKITECLFADDGALISATRPGAERAVLEYQAASTSFGLTVSITKTKHMAVGGKPPNVTRPQSQ